MLMVVLLWVVYPLALRQSSLLVIAVESNTYKYPLP